MVSISDKAGGDFHWISSIFFNQLKGSNTALSLHPEPAKASESRQEPGCVTPAELLAEWTGKRNLIVEGLDISSPSLNAAFMGEMIKTSRIGFQTKWRDGGKRRRVLMNQKWV